MKRENCEHFQGAQWARRAWTADPAPAIGRPAPARPPPPVFPSLPPQQNWSLAGNGRVRIGRPRSMDASRRSGSERCRFLAWFSSRLATALVAVARLVSLHIDGLNRPTQLTCGPQAQVPQQETNTRSEPTHAP
ncbi:hypothetical protein GGTG_11748 [Gaeumannomyces tritici R3-111a-1]|uniref:Uncharacterized protein n=1 Tax=Gaeumannomyces tritici (strain R3-111a-1) TaxID=644352 RepID=J3PE25_GAET3|nr:hypothetical protein GGTG_11748 [Gaeumannomyces tritici R3-111a-1]EJT70725.1 hypothetical protein GGTG_11748 [Gaeumannomyces tritici R3-111a-1]